MKAKILLLLMALCATSLCAETFTYDIVIDELRYRKLTDSTVEVSMQPEVQIDSDGSYAYTILRESDLTLRDVVIPEAIIYNNSEYQVVRIGFAGFCGLDSISSVTIPNSVQNIGDYAFYLCSNLTAVSLPNGIIHIGDFVFSGCKSLVSIAIPDGVTRIGEGAFHDCKSLTSIAIPNSVTNIGIEAFAGCMGLATITIPNSVTDIGRGAFRNCESMTSFVIPSGIASIEHNVFQDCAKLTSIIIPNSVTSIGNNAFYSCLNLASIDIPNSVKAIGRYAFWGCESLTTITIPNSITAIEECVFACCENLTSVVIPNSVESIGLETFVYCSSLESITIPKSVKYIGRGAFRSCTGLESISIENNDSLTISWGAFENCSYLSSVICYMETPPVIKFSYYEVPSWGITIRHGAFDDRTPRMKLFVPATAISAYQAAEEWKDFGQILPIGAMTVDTDDEQPVVEPSFAEVTITWKITPNAETYTIVITRGTETVYTLTFNADGQLTNIAFAAPSRNGTPRHAPAATMTAQGYQFTVTGLESGTQYDYTLSVKDSNGKELQNYAGTFRTQGESTAIDNPSADKATDQTKVIRDGQVLILRGGKTYTVTGMEVE